MADRRSALTVGRRVVGLACAGLGVWLVVLGASASTDLSQVAGALLGCWAASVGAGLLLVPARAAAPLFVVGTDPHAPERGRGVASLSLVGSSGEGSTGAPEG